MKKCWIPLFTGMTVLFSSQLHATMITHKNIEPFQQYTSDFPTFFKTWPFQRGEAKSVYQIKKEGENIFLSARDDQNLSRQIFREFDWKLSAFPYFKWRWRAQTLPKGAAENNPALNDSACGVYIIFGKTTGTALKFVWSTTLPVDSVYEKRPNKMVIKVLDSGTKHLGKWRRHAIHIPTTYAALLKHGVKRAPTGFAILTDGNATKTPAACDYDDFQISSTPDL